MHPVAVVDLCDCVASREQDAPHLRPVDAQLVSEKKPCDILRIVCSEVGLNTNIFHPCCCGSDRQRIGRRGYAFFRISGTILLFLPCQLGRPTATKVFFTSPQMRSSIFLLTNVPLALKRRAIQG